MRRVELYNSIQLHGNHAANVQSQAGTLHKSVELLEAIEYAFSHFSRHTFARIGDAECHPARIFAQRCMQQNLAALGVLLGVGEEVHQHLLQTLAVALNGEIVANLGGVIQAYAFGATVLDARQCPMANSIDNALREPDFHCRTVLDCREQQYVVDERGQRLGVFVNQLNKLLALVLR